MECEHIGTDRNMIYSLFGMAFVGGPVITPPSRPPVAHQMEKGRCDEAHRVQPVEHATMAFDDIAPSP
jgi:hypothetical protein